MPLDQPSLENNNGTEEKEMTFLEHLEELRWHILRSVIAIVVFTILAFFFINDIYKYIILGPVRTDFWTYQMMCKLSEVFGYADLCVQKIDLTLQNRQLAGQFTMALFSSFFIGLVFTFPYLFWEVWRFVSPGLKVAERKAARGAVFFVTMLFFMGVLFGYYIVSPLTINFLANFKLDESIPNQIDISDYISTLVTLALASGLAFQLPIVVFVLSKIGLVTPKFMREYRRHAYLVVLIVAGIITPSPDILSQVLVSVPLIILFELSIGVSARVEKYRKAEELANDGYEAS
jgi:sec-independent protein translocase protein TatC